MEKEYIKSMIESIGGACKQNGAIEDKETVAVQYNSIFWIAAHS